MCVLARAHNLLYQAKELFSVVYDMLDAVKDSALIYRAFHKNNDADKN